MKDPDSEKFATLLRDVIQPVGAPELGRDLWTELSERRTRPRLRIRWFDWALAAVAVALCSAVPEAIFGLLYHL